MAQEEIKTNRGSWTIDTSLDGILGKGAYGIVYRGKNSMGNDIAAKRIDTLDGKKLPNISGLEKLIELDHPNIVKVFDIHQTDKEIWIFMDLCQGDLNKFFSGQNISQDQMINIMKQVTTGIVYLHGKGVIHQDIKPHNILIYNESPLLVKLTDFDVSKFLEESATLTMSANVSTLAYKAPEFFQRSKDGKLNYHSNIDTFAAGVTFLAMLQIKESKKLTIPQIETPRSDSEHHAPSIGQLIAERIKYDVKELNVVTVEDITRSSAADIKVNVELKKIIQKMTAAGPKKRLSPAEVLVSLQTVEVMLIEAKIKQRMRLKDERNKDMKHDVNYKLDEQKRILLEQLPELKLLNPLGGISIGNSN